MKGLNQMGFQAEMYCFIIPQSHACLHHGQVASAWA